MVLGKQASCLRTVGSQNPDPKIAALEEELKELGNSIGMGAMGFMGSSMVVDCHIEVGYCHTGGMPMSVHMFCLSSRRATARVHRRRPRRVPHRPDVVHRLHAARDRGVGAADGRGGGVTAWRRGLKTVHLDLPASTADLRALEIGSVAYLTGRVFTAREGVYKRAIEDGAGMPASREALGLVNFHCSPAAAVNADGSHTVGAVTATASFRFAKWLDGWFALSGCNIIIGKGGMTSEDLSADRSCRTSAIYLTTVGYGTGALLGRGIRRVAGVYWLEELGLAQAVWVLEVEKFGPFLVESDLDGNSLFERENAKIAPGIERLYAGHPAGDSCAATARPTTRPKS